MDYQNIYNKIIDRAKNRPIIDNEYYEKHHIKPKCIGGGNEPDNLVLLFPNEHLICHLLLSKIYPKNIGLIRAVLYMIGKGKNKNKNYSKNKTYQIYKQKFHAYFMSKRVKKYCKNCRKKMLIPKHLEKTKKFCCKKCLTISSRIAKIEKINCRNCGKECLKIGKKEKFFCNMNCYDNYRNNYKILRKPCIEKNCLNCNKKMFLEPNQKEKKFCSKSCYKQKYLKPKINKNCIICGIQFFVIPSLSRIKCCSLKCSNKSKTKEYRQNQL